MIIETLRQEDQQFVIRALGAMLDTALKPHLRNGRNGSLEQRGQYWYFVGLAQTLSLHKADDSNAARIYGVSQALFDQVVDMTNEELTSLALAGEPLERSAAACALEVRQAKSVSEL